MSSMPSETTGWAIAPVTPLEHSARVTSIVTVVDVAVTRSESTRVQVAAAPTWGGIVAVTSGIALKAVRAS